jgi:hypothetical protein
VAVLTDVTGLHTVQATGGFEATTEGTTTITCTATNQDGATSSTRLETIAIDTTAPALTARVKPRATANTGWYTARTGRPQVIWTCADTLPGSDLPPKPCPAVVVDEGAEQLVRLDLYDLAGNVTSGSVGPLNGDVTPPAIDCLPANFPLGKRNARVKGAVTDATSGPRKATVNQAVATTAPGDFAASLQAIDVAGNKATVACPYHVG